MIFLFKYFSFPYNIAPYKCVILPLNDTDKRYEPLTNRLCKDSCICRISFKFLISFVSF